MFNKIVFALGNKLLPRRSAECVLHVCDTFSVRVVEYLATDQVVGRAHSAHLLTIRNIDNLNGIRQNGDAVRLDEP